MKLINLEWLNTNANRRYPLCDDSDGIDDSDSFVIPKSFIVEIDLPINISTNVDPAKFYIKTIGAYSTGYSVVVGCSTNDGEVDVATAQIPSATHTKNKAYVLGGIEPFDDTRGKIVIGDLGEINNQPAGVWLFSLSHTRLDTDVIRPLLRGVSSLIVVNGNQESIPITGDIVFQAGTNVRLDTILVEDQDPVIVINAINGEGLDESCICEGDRPPRIPILTINGIPPDANNNFQVIGGDCVEIEETTNGIRITDTCSAPCCDCEDLEKITRKLEELNTQVATTQDFANRLGVAVDTMSLTVLGARLGDKGCVTC